jgi:uncharacterized protein YidB (DUF937 family)
MFDQILQMVKEHMAGNPQLAAAIPAEQADAVHQEIATHINNGLQGAAVGGGTQGGMLAGLQNGGAGGLLSQFENSLSSGNLLTSAISGGLIGSLGSKFGLSSAVTGAIAASLPGLLQKFGHPATGANGTAH